MSHRTRAARTQDGQATRARSADRAEARGPGGSAHKDTGSRRSGRAPTRGSRLGRWAFPAIMTLAGIAAVAIVVVGVGAATATPVHAVRPILGSSTAPVTLVEYADYQCPFCATWAKTVEPQIVTNYVNTGKVRIEWHDMAWMGNESKAAANAARCAGDQGKYWAYHDLLYESQGAQNSGAFSTAHLKAFGARLGLDTKTFDACVDADTYGAAVQADYAEATQLGITGTPAFFVNGQRIEGAQPYSTFAAAINAALGQ